jgi:hypothetical protein
MEKPLQIKHLLDEMRFRAGNPGMAPGIGRACGLFSDTEASGKPRFSS